MGTHALARNYLASGEFQHLRGGVGCLGVSCVGATCPRFVSSARRTWAARTCPGVACAGEYRHEAQPVRPGLRSMARHTGLVFERCRGSMSSLLISKRLIQPVTIIT